MAFLPRRLHHERCIRQEESVASLRAAGLDAILCFPKASADLNAIEGVWALLRARLDATAPAGTERRQAFIAKLRGAVLHLNTTRKSELLYMCGNMRERARDVMAATPAGSRTRW